MYLHLFCRLQVNIASDEKGFQCTFTMDRPEHNKYIYSMALSATASGKYSRGRLCNSVYILICTIVAHGICCCLIPAYFIL